MRVSREGGYPARIEARTKERTKVEVKGRTNGRDLDSSNDDLVSFADDGLVLDDEVVGRDCDSRKESEGSADGSRGFERREEEEGEKTEGGR